MAAPDAILGITEAFRNDTSPTKVNLGVGVYQDANGKIPVLNSVLQAAKIWSSQEDTKTYLPIDGVPAFIQANQELLFGKDSPLLKEKRVATVQSVGGSGGLKLGIEFIKRFLGKDTIYISDPSWENHRVIFEAAGMKVETYPYYDPKTSGLRAADMLSTLRNLQPRTPVLLHACCHNPTGVDLDEQTWKEVVTICAERELIPFIDFAYQGFADGIVPDSRPIQLFVEKGLTFFLSNSFAKSLSLYRERVGAISVVTGSQKEAVAVTSQIKRIVRMIYSSPPSYGAQLAAIVLTHPELRPMWETELGEMRDRIHEMRHLFAKRLKEVLPDRDFSFILSQRGMFSYSGLSMDIMKALREKYHIYGLDSGRICVAALNHKNVDYVCESIASLVKGV
ncbi:MAG: aromatic-amino-acid transaminase [Pseudomonadota bacterium]